MSQLALNASSSDALLCNEKMLAVVKDFTGQVLELANQEWTSNTKRTLQLADHEHKRQKLLHEETSKKIDLLRGQVARLEEEIKKQKDSMKKKDTKITEQDASIKAKDAKIEEQDASIKAKDDNLKKLKTSIENQLATHFASFS